MKVVVVGGTGLIGKRLVALLTAEGHAVVVAAPSTGVNAVTGEGVAAALAGADVVVDVANAPSFEDAAVKAFFEASTGHLLAAAAHAGVRHYVALSVVGTERLQGSGYFRAKWAQEQRIRAGGVPYTLVRATQFFEFMDGIAQSGVQGEDILLPMARMQPMAADDVAAMLAGVVDSTPVEGIVEIAGPEARPMATFVADHLRTCGDKREVRATAGALYFGVSLDDDTLLPTGAARIAPTDYATWSSRK
ncbi:MULTISPECIES: SDR family oxidoreductase [unclassified Pseudoxanthomonas]|jgi:uncharacterized protein YbjT (DUF2867 family)|uniref:SDR family oxidoreductase n=1 Tax=unclassified Pseudoxanthomonas TaxID=2645906 RepID=UPI00307D245E